MSENQENTPNTPENEAESFTSQKPPLPQLSTPNDLEDTKPVRAVRAEALIPAPQQIVPPSPHHSLQEPSLPLQDEEEIVTFGDAISQGFSHILIGTIAGAYSGAVWFIAALLILVIGLLLTAAVGNGWSFGAILFTTIILLIIVAIAVAYLGPIFVIIGIIVGIVGGIVGAVTGFAIGVASLIFFALLSYTPLLRKIRNTLIFITSIAFSIIGIQFGISYFNSDAENLGWFMGINSILAVLFGSALAIVIIAPPSTNTGETQEEGVASVDNSFDEALASPFKFYGKIASWMWGANNNNYSGNDVRLDPKLEKILREEKKQRENTRIALEQYEKMSKEFKNKYK